LQILAIRHPPAGTPLSSDQLSLQQGVIYLLPPRWLQLCWDTCISGWAIRVALFKRWFYLLTAVILA